MSENKKKYAYWMKPSMVEEITEMLDTANATSKVILFVRLFSFTLVIYISKNALIISHLCLHRPLKVKLKVLRKIYPKCCSRLLFNKLN